MPRSPTAYAHFSKAALPTVTTSPRHRSGGELRERGATDEQQNKRTYSAAEWRCGCTSARSETQRRKSLQERHGHRENENNDEEEKLEWKVTRDKEERAVYLYRSGGGFRHYLPSTSLRLLPLFRRALSSLSPFLSYRKRRGGSSDSPTARLVVVGEVVFFIQPAFSFFLFFLSAARPHGAAVRVKTSFVCVCFPFTCRQRAG